MEEKIRRRSDLQIKEDTRINLKTEKVNYRHGNDHLERYLAYDDAIQGKRPGVLVVHCFRGLRDFVKERTEQLANLGYISFALDMYGVMPEDDQKAFALAKLYGADRPLMRSRANAGLEVLRRHDLVDIRRIGAMGYCFGGGVVLELARSGAEIAGLVGFHANLNTPNREDAKNIKGKVLILHGADDPLVPMDQVLTFQEEMRKAEVDWQMVFYGNAVHAFTMPESDTDPSKQVAYNEKADKRSWEAMKFFFQGDIFILKSNQTTDSSNLSVGIRLSLNIYHLHHENLFEITEVYGLSNVLICS
ncbi:dienelactone hydrolase family protein [Thermodesulfobacteriota bacterium]